MALFNAPSSVPEADHLLMGEDAVNNNLKDLFYGCSNSSPSCFHGSSKDFDLWVERMGDLGPHLLSEDG